MAGASNPTNARTATLQLEYDLDQIVAPFRRGYLGAPVHLRILDVGRVQAPTLGLVVARDRAIREFMEKPYWELRAILSLDNDRKQTGRWLPDDKEAAFLDAQKRIADPDAAKTLRSKIDGQSGEISQVGQKDHRSAPPLPYSLSKLQMAASQKYDITDTLTHLQKLYEAGYVTYPRTDCDYLPEGHFAEGAKIFEAVRVGCPDLGDMMTDADENRKSPAWNDKKVTEHHAIIPTVHVPLPDALSNTERRIYELTCARYVMQFLSDYEYQETTVEFGVNGETFRATGRTVLNLGWQGWEKSAKNENKKQREKENGDEENAGGENGEAEEVQTLPQVREGETGGVQATLDQKNTKSPAPYTYHALVKDMNSVHNYVEDAEIRAKLKEIKGIGTAATQETVIATLFARGYIEKKKKNLYPTELGKRLIQLLSAGKASVVVKPDLTTLWEQKMSDIERGEAFEPFIDEVADMVREIIAEPLEIPTDIPGMKRLEKCLTADCGGFLRRIEKKGKSPFFACPVCRSTFNDVDGKPAPRKEFSGEIIEAPCPRKCGGNARRFEGAYGAFWKCSCSPELMKDIDGQPVVKDAQAKADCPVKGCKGKAMFLRSKKDQRPFWVCDTCTNFFDDVEGKPVVRATKPKKKA